MISSRLYACRYSGWSKSKLKVVNVASEGVERICGIDLLSNDAVNALSAALTSLGMACCYKGIS